MISPQNIIEAILAQSNHRECMVVVEESTEANLRWANSTLTTNGSIHSRKITALVFVELDGGLAVGGATRAQVQPDEIADFLQEAEASARAAGVAMDVAPLLTDQGYGDWDAEHASTGPEVFSRVAPVLGDVFHRSVSDGIELFGYAEHSATTVWLGSRGGLRMRYDQPVGRIEMTGKSHGRSRSSWEGRATQDFSDIDILNVDQGIRQQLEWQGTQIEMPAGRYETLLTPSAVSDLLVYAMWMADGISAHQGRSVFSKAGGGTRIGEMIANLPINLFSEPLRAGMQSVPFQAVTESGPHISVFDNGHALGHVDWLKDGVLTNLIQTRSSAAMMDATYTSFPDNLILESPGASGNTMDLVARCEDGLLLNTMWYIRTVDAATLLLTGLTRDGVYRIKNGEIVGAVNNFRWNESPVDLLSRISDIGATEITQAREWAGDAHRMAMPPVRFSNFNMSTVSQAN
jgi:predicted Zn-dependent protease